MKPQKLHLGTRGSPLARWQADWIAQWLQQQGVAVEMVYVTTQGDARPGPIGSIGGQGIFTKEIQRALLDGTIDLAVHSLKDLPTESVEGLELAAIPPRESPRDVLVSRGHVHLADLPPGARIGTGSLRRQAQLLHARPDFQLLDIRGNVDTRLRKLKEGQYDAIILAEAGLRRLQLEEHITEVLPPQLMLPAVGQGALAVEIRSNDEATRECLAGLNDRDTRQAVLAERALLAALRGGCLAPVGAWGRVEDDQLRLDAVVLSADGTRRLYVQLSGSPESCVQLGQEAARGLLEQGAGELIAQSRAGKEED